MADDACWWAGMDESKKPDRAIGGEAKLGEQEDKTYHQEA